MFLLRKISNEFTHLWIFNLRVYSYNSVDRFGDINVLLKCRNFKQAVKIWISEWILLINADGFDLCQSEIHSEDVGDSLSSVWIRLEHLVSLHFGVKGLVFPDISGVIQPALVAANGHQILGDTDITFNVVCAIFNTQPVQNIRKSVIIYRAWGGWGGGARRVLGGHTDERRRISRRQQSINGVIHTNWTQYPCCQWEGGMRILPNLIGESTRLILSWHNESLPTYNENLPHTSFVL